MRKAIVQEFLSLDGYAADSAGKVDFVPASMQGDQSFGRRQLAFMDSVDTILLGRVTYEMFSQHWPNVAEGDEKEFADKINAMTKIVFSKTLQKAPWGKWPEAKIIRSDAAAEVANLRKESGKDMVLWGSLSVAQSLMRAGQVDEYQLIICPVVFGDGKQLFRDDRKMKLVETKSFDRSAVLLTYRSSM